MIGHTFSSHLVPAAVCALPLPQLREPGKEMAYRIPFAVRHKKNIQKNGRYFITLYDHHTAKPLKLVDFEPQVRPYSNILTCEQKTDTCIRLVRRLLFDAYGGATLPQQQCSLFVFVYRWYNAVGTVGVQHYQQWLTCRHPVLLPPGLLSNQAIIRMPLPRFASAGA
jgi:hypothetical protein